MSVERDQDFDYDMVYEIARDEAGIWLEKKFNGFFKELTIDLPNYYKYSEQKLLEDLKDFIEWKIKEIKKITSKK